MDQELKTKWCAALRSGEFQQGKQALCKGDQYCCLGVLAKILGELQPIGDRSGVWGIKSEQTEDFLCAVLPGNLLKRIGLSVQNHENLWTMNDFENLSFSQIADWIETNL